MESSELEKISKSLLKLESESRKLSPSAATKKDWLQSAQDFSLNFLKQLSSEKAYYYGEDGAGILEHSIDDKALSLESLLDIIQKDVNQAGINAASPGHMGYIPGGGLFPSAIGDLIAAITNRYAGIFYASPGAVRIENLLIQWMCELMGFPTTATGNITSGGSISNLIAIVSARDSFPLKARDFEKAVIYLTEQAHHSLQKAIRIAGMNEAIIRYIPIDSNYSMIVDKLEEQIQADKALGLIPFFVNASLGTTNTGSVDNIAAIGSIAKSHQLWFHIDGAYGGFFKLVEDCAPYFEGVEQADSITLDPHKSLFLPFGTGAVLIKDPKTVLKSHYYLADYMQDSYASNHEISPADVSPELTKHFRGLRFWLPLKLFGLAPFRAALKEKIVLANYFYYKIQEIKNFELGPKPALSIVMFRYISSKGDSNEVNKKLLERIQRDGRIFLSSTSINGVFWIRVAVLVFRTHKEHLDLLLEIIQQESSDLT